METFISEIRTFAKLNHKHLVKYNNSWIEVELIKTKNNNVN
jgi:hypothetical protein